MQKILMLIILALSPMAYADFYENDAQRVTMGGDEDIEPSHDKHKDKMSDAQRATMGGD